MITQLIIKGDVTFSLLIAEFLLSACFVLVFASKLSRYCDALEQKSDISAIWIGTILLAAITSLPEAVTTIGSAIMEGAMDLGTANLFGSNTFNLITVVVLDLIQGSGPLMLQVQSSLVSAAAGGIVMMVIAGGTVAAFQFGFVSAQEAWLGPVLSLFCIGAYILLSRLTTQDLGIQDTAETEIHEHTEYGLSLPRIVGRIVIYAAALVLVSVWLLRVCDAMAVTPFRFGARDVTLGRTLTGTFLLSAATSFPELFVSIAAFRLGQTNMAIGNLLGSNMVNMLFIPIMHAATRSTVFYSRVDAPSILTLAVVGICMTLVFVLGLRLRSRKSFLLLGCGAIAMLAIYILGAVLVVRLGLSI